MKSKGQVLVAFLLLLPLLFFLIAFIVDLGIENVHYKKMRDTVEDILSSALRKEASYEEVELLFIKNGFSKEEFTLEKKEEGYLVQIVFSFKSFFGKMWRKDTKEILKYLAYKEKEKIIVQRMEE